jgi:antitoxin CcdA
MTIPIRTPKVRTNLTLDAKIVAAAKAEGLSLSAIAEAAIEQAVKAHRLTRWLEENRPALAAHSRDIEENGLWSDGLRQF